ncbi:hypothetical protein TBCH5v1_0441 [Thermococcus barophilus]|uniref:Uncharacterized protein n=1 Tax=Thermococcus barophilus TaxID=55802 RepID=A0A0S1X9C4_THEBA|nr:hypothetical protein TBCH5v1_0441 [Thermococcus barophilus]
MVFEKGTFDGDSIVLYVLCEDSLFSNFLTKSLNYHEPYSLMVRI